MDWLPVVALVMALVGMALTENRYFRAVRTIRSDNEWAAEVRQQPRRLISVVSSETLMRLKALGTRQRDLATERKRMVVLLFILLVLICCVWVVIGTSAR